MARGRIRGRYTLPVDSNCEATAFRLTLIPALAPFLALAPSLAPALAPALAPTLAPTLALGRSRRPRSRALRTSPAT